MISVLLMVQTNSDKDRMPVIGVIRELEMGMSCPVPSLLLAGPLEGVLSVGVGSKDDRAPEGSYVCVR